MRDDFPESVKMTLMKRVGNKCSAPDCRALTSGPNEDSTKSVNLGEAAHITAASPGGKRYDPLLTSDQRKHPDNGIWLCSGCAKKIDDDEIKYTVALINTWKSLAEKLAAIAVGKTSSTLTISQEELSDIEIRLFKAASITGDIVLFKYDGGHYLSTPIIDLINMPHSERVQFIEALNSLTIKKLFSRELPVNSGQGTLYELTSDGYSIVNSINELRKS